MLLYESADELESFCELVWFFLDLWRVFMRSRYLRAEERRASD